MTMEELHEKRGEYVKRVREAVAGDLLKNGLELEAASLTQLDQTGMEFFNPSNAFDAEGLTRLTEQIEHRKKQRNDIEQDTMIPIRNKNLEAEKLSLDIDREAEYARLHAGARGRDRARRASAPSWRASAPSASRRPRARRSSAREAIERGAHPLASARSRRSASPRSATIQAAEIERRKALELAEQQRAIAVAAQSKAAERGAGRGRPGARRAPSSAEEKVFTAREIEMAERQKTIEPDRRRAGRRARGAAADACAAEAEKAASDDRGAAMRAQAEAEADADKIRSLAMRIRAEIEAEACA